MQVEIDVQSVDGLTRRLLVTVPAGDVDAELARAYKTLSRNAKVPGFRPGHAPRRVLERMHGAAVEAEVFERMTRDSLAKALADSELDVVAVSKLETQKARAGQPLQYEATIEVRPEVVAHDYLGLPAVRRLEPTSDEEVERQLQGLREAHGQLRPIEGRAEVAPEDILAMDLEVRRGARVLGRHTDQRVAPDARALPQEVFAALVGRRVGETVAVDVPSDEEGGEPTTFVVTVRGLFRKDLPELDDDFAKDCSDCTSLDELRAEVRSRLTAAAEARAERAVEDEIAAKLLEAHPFDVPPSMVESRLARSLAELRQAWNRRGASAAEVRDAESRIVGDMRRRSEEQVRLDFILASVAARESLTVSADEVRERFEALSKTMSPSELEHAAHDAEALLARIRAHLVGEKAMRFLVERASVTTVTGTSDVAEPVQTG